MAYTPTPVPREGVNNEYLYQELLRISNELTLAEEGRQIPVRMTAPQKPREGMLVRADGTSWNPGFGAGYYEYRAGGWRKLIEQGENISLDGQASSAWGGGFRAIESDNAAVGFLDTVNGVYLLGNCYYDGTNWRYKETGAATIVDSRGTEGTINMRVAPSGSAGAIITFTQPFILSNAGDVNLTAQLNMPEQAHASGTLAATTGSNYNQGITATKVKNVTVGADSLTVTKAGLYLIMVKQLISCSAAVYLYISINGSFNLYGYCPGAATFDIVSFSLPYLNAGDVVRFYYGGTVTSAWGGGHSSFVLAKLG